MKWYHTSIYFILRWNSGFSVKEIASLLFTRRSTGKVDNQKPKVAKNRETHRASFPASQAALYSASLEENTIVF